MELPKKGAEPTRRPGGFAQFQSRSTPAILQTQKEDLSESYSGLSGRIASSSTTRLQTKHKRSLTEGQESGNRNTFTKFSRLLDTVLGSSSNNIPSPALMTSSMDALTSRSPSPTLSVDYTLVSIPSLPGTPRLQSTTTIPLSSCSTTPENIVKCSSKIFSSPSRKGTVSNNATIKSSMNAPTNKRIFPKLWTALGSPKDNSTRLKRKGKGKSQVYDGYFDLPLDGEEGELVDDEACFVDIPKTIDILSNVPPEIALYILLFADLKTILACLRVSHGWHHLASDPLVWRALFHSVGWEVDNELAQHRLYGTRPSQTQPARNNSLTSMAASVRNELDNTLNRMRRGQPPLTPPHSRNQYRQSVASTSTFVDLSLSPSSLLSSSIPEGSLAPLALDWHALYKTRFELDKRVYGSPSSSNTQAEDATYDPPHIMTLLGHADSVYCVEFDSYKIVTGSRDKTIKVWSLKSGKLKATLRGHEGSVLCLKFDSTGFMVSGSSDRKILVWDLGRAEIKKAMLGHNGGVLDIRMDKKWIVSCSKDTAIRVWNRDTLELHCSFHGHDGPVNAVGLQDGKIVSASGDGRMMLWDIATQSKIRTFEGHTLGLACIEFKDDIICSGSNDRQIKVWAVSTGECLATLSGHSGLVRALSFNPRTGRLVSGGYDQTVKLWDIKTGRLIRQFQDTHQSHIFDVKFDAAHIVSTSHDQKIVVLDWSRGLDASLFV